MKDFLRFLQLTLGENLSPALSSATLLGRRDGGFSPLFTADTRGKSFPGPLISDVAGRRDEGFSPLFTADTRGKSFPGPLTSNVAVEKRWRIVSTFYSWQPKKSLPLSQATLSLHISPNSIYVLWGFFSVHCHEDDISSKWSATWVSSLTL